ncbi:hypothetical protein EW145_g1430 [Phellinidium pouzarii]|uniref:3-hydroxyisobutyrate dehydrogenase n=1 Tax=Phellinidium pouzarii TaxID=167371 RepID=A0A4S4LET0_9AGAM|nr:hypothetical protein EW145_g1430 [Phellinidium pouzarii]
MRFSPTCLNLRALTSHPSGHPSRASSISFLGLGRMGSEMAFNLFSKRHALANSSTFVVCDAVPEAARAFVANFQNHFPGSQLSIVSTPEEAVLASQTIVTMLPSSPQVRSVYSGDSGVLSALQALPRAQAEETLCIDSTTLDIDVARQVSAHVVGTGAQMVDAPVSGGTETRCLRFCRYLNVLLLRGAWAGVTGAKVGSLAFLVGGTDTAFELAKPFIADMGRRAVHCGPAGSGLVAKICNNLMLGVQQVVTSEAMLLGQRLGVRADVLADVIGSATALHDKAPPSERDFEGGFATALMVKLLMGRKLWQDMGLAFKSANLVGTALPLGTAAKRIYEDVIESSPELARKDFSNASCIMSAEKPSAIIFGGLNTWSRRFALFLIPDGGEPLVSHLRIVDKFSVHPATTYLGADFPPLLENPNVQYKQANLTIPAIVKSMFDPPEGQAPYSYVFDLTGEVRHDRPDMVQIQQTVNIARLVGEEAARREVKAYVRVTQAFYETSEKGTHTEKESVKPSGIRGVWWHETLRVLANIENLNLVILRPGLVYGPHVEYGILTTTMTVASVYGYLQKPMKGLWPPGKNSMNTVHVEDVAGAAFALAEWMAKEGRKEADILAGEEIPSNDKGKIKEGTGLPETGKKLVAPLFNIVDNSNGTLYSIGAEICGLFGTTFGFHDFFTTTMAKITKLSESILEDINEEHVSGWVEMIMASDPPIPNTPLSAYMDESVLQKIVVAFNADKIKNIVGYTLKHPEFSQAELKDVVDRWKSEGSWPNTFKVPRLCELSHIQNQRRSPFHVYTASSTNVRADLNVDVAKLIPTFQIVFERVAFDMADTVTRLRTVQTRSYARESVDLKTLPMEGEQFNARKEGRWGDGIAKLAVQTFMGIPVVYTAYLMLSSNPSSLSWFAYHPPLQMLAVGLFTYGILTLQPTSQPKTKAVGLVRHQLFMLFTGLPVLGVGTWVIYYNKEINTRPHALIGYIAVGWAYVQVLVGCGSVWFGGAAFGGGMKAKSIWKYHRGRISIIPSVFICSPLGRRMVYVF